jgi:hypothetical protein
MFSLIGAFITFFHRHGGFGEVDGVIPVIVQEDVKNTKGKKGKKNQYAAVVLNKTQYFLQKNPKQLQTIISKIYIFAFIWGFGGCLKVSCYFKGLCLSHMFFL